ncbi:hypothetical protein [Pseudomonas sp. EpS/L25]|uniref:hypothetical protein n=1 Tax=Pseudomonas sp. EpS/L25 TaxID=1749078 RepID=UPI000B02E04A|nr:hypothetical protein [Pseudomonas sp. EpS/L25]
MRPSRRLLLGLASLTLASLVLGLALPPRWQALPAAGAILLLGLAALERWHPRWYWAGLWQRPAARFIADRARQRPHTLHLLLDSRAPAGRSAWQQDQDQALGFARHVAASGNAVRVYGFDPNLRLLAATAPGRNPPLPPTVALQPGTGGELKAVLAQLCRQVGPDGLIVVVTPMAEERLEWLARLEVARRGLTLWLVGTLPGGPLEPRQLSGPRTARAYAEAWKTQIRHERLALRLARLGITWLPASGAASLQTRLLALWEAADEGQTADWESRPKVK